MGVISPDQPGPSALPQYGEGEKAIEAPGRDDKPPRGGDRAPDSVASEEAGGEGEEEPEGDKPVLTLSKARCIALVATVTGASLLNVRFAYCPMG